MGSRFRPQVPILLLLHQISDAAIGAVIFLALSYYFNSFHDRVFGAALLIFFVALVCFQTVGLYQSWRVAPVFKEIEKILAGCLILYSVLIFIFYFLGILDRLSHRVMISLILVLPVVLGIERVVVRTILRHFRKKGYNVRKAVIAGAGELADRLVHLIEVNPWSGTQLMGFFHDDPNVEIKGCSRLGSLAELPEYTRENNIEIVYVTLPMREERTIQHLFKELNDSTAAIHLVPDIFYIDLLLGADLSYFDNLPIITLRETPLQGLNAALKRSVDLLFASLLLLIASPIMILVAMAILFTSGPPILFKQWRYGLNGQAIQIYKFRTMTVCEDGHEFKQATQCDPRITPLGKFLRRTSLDELPQLINIIQGRMSLVGPRPHPVAMNEKYRKVIPGYMLRHKVRPGLTGLAQVNGWRGETDTLEKIEMRIEHDLYYLRHWSLLLDLKIMIKTITKGSWRTNAH